jgi:hypothetical protein
MRSMRIVAVILACLVASLSGCSLWNRVWVGRGDQERRAETPKASAPATVERSKAETAPGATAAAATKPADQAQAKENEVQGDKRLTESQKEWEDRIARSPWLVGGEYFRQREPGGTFNLDLGRLFGRSKEDEAKRKSLEERIARLEAELSGGVGPNPAPATAVPRSKAVRADAAGPINRVALVAVEPETPNPTGFGRIPMEIVATALEKERRLIVVEPPLVDRVLQDHQIRPSSANAKQVATLLERDLGTQLVILLDEAAVSADWDRRGHVHAQVVLKGEIREGITGQAVSLLTAKGAQTGSGSQEALAKVEALKQASDQLSAAILKKALEYEWSARVLSVEDGRVRLNAGRRSGLQEGDLLRVFKSDGQEIYHPATKLFVGLDLGDPKGKVQVTDFFGADAAIAKITEGSGFAPNDLIKLDRR